MQYPANGLKTNGTSILILNIKKKYIYIYGTSIFFLKMSGR